MCNWHGVGYARIEVKQRAPTAAKNIGEVK
jgi:hypothetical protein